MKIRTGHVSNSFSSSFILYHQCDIDLVTSKGFKVFKVKDLLEKFKIIFDLQYAISNEIDKLEDSDNIPSFLNYELSYSKYDLHLPEIIPFSRELKRVYDENNDTWITEAIDRDYAYDENFNFPEFIGDL